MSEKATLDTTSPWVAATPGRVMSTLAYLMLAEGHWPVYVNTSRNYTGIYDRDQEPTDPGDTAYGSARLRPVMDFHPLAPEYPYADGWENAAAYLDDRIRPHNVSTMATPDCVTGAWDEYFLVVESRYGGSITAGEDCVAASNHRSLLRDYPDTFVEQSYGYGGPGSLLVPLFVPADPADADHPHYDRDRAEDLARTLVHLRDEYPLYDEMDHSELESEREEDAISDSWQEGQIREGVADELAKLLGVEGSADSRWYDVTERLDDWLSEQNELPDWYGTASEGYLTVYSLFLYHQSEHGYVVHESGGVTFTHEDETYWAIADHIIRSSVKLPTRTALGLE